jgi:hypothetical protein
MRRRCLFVVPVMLMASSQAAVAQYDQNTQPNAFGVPTLPGTPPVLTTPPAVSDTPQPGFPGHEQAPLPSQPSPAVAQPAPMTPSTLTPSTPPPPGPPPPRPRARTEPTPAPAPQSPPITVQQYLVSVWHGTAVDNFGTWDIYVAFKPDGEFVQNKTLNGGQFRMTIMGRYNAQLSSNGGMLTMFPQRWEPARFCVRIGDCRVIPMQSTVEVAFQPINHDTFQTRTGTFQRVNSER